MYMQGIRKRLSYQRYKKALDFLKTNPTTAEILRYIYRLEDSNCVFGSISKSEYARESLEHLIKDEKLAEPDKETKELVQDYIISAFCHPNEGPIHIMDDFMESIQEEGIGEDTMKEAEKYFREFIQRYTVDSK